MSVLLSKLMVKPSFSKAFWPSMYQKAGITEAAFLPSWYINMH